ncbi:serine protease [Accumulibacter sp.]|uniref:S1 family peptidase n=1 Tax=Accumulibacter sp. TaxID=2053492 RepID=UPI0035B464C3
MNWDQVVKKIAPHVLKIETPTGHGTGFLFLYNDAKTWCGIATAEHVVSHADSWQQPIKIHHPHSGKTVFLKQDERVIYRDWKTDSAVILFFKGELQIPESPVALLPMGTLIDIGSEVGWLGFPSVAPHDLCFFSGNISARQEYRNAYLVDGVAINGVSGGPVLHLTETDGVQIVGTISAYSANRATGEVLPGLAIAQDVSHFHDVANHVHSIDEANKKKQEFESQQSSGQEA